MTKSSSRTAQKARRSDRIARWVITAGGMTIIVCVVAILLLIAGVTLPLFLPARADLLHTVRLPASIALDDVLDLGVDLSLDDRRAVATVLTRDGALALLDLNQGDVLGTQRAAAAPGRTIRAVERSSGSRFSLLWSDGSATLMEIAFSPPPGGDGKPGPPFALRSLVSLPPEKNQQPRLALVRQGESGAVTRVDLLPENHIAVLRQVTQESLAGDEQTKTHRLLLDEPAIGPIRALTMDREGATLYAGAADGRLVRWQLNADGEVATREVVRAFADKRAITALAMVQGDVSLAVGDERGDLTTWFPVRDGARTVLRRIHSLRQHAGPVRTILPCQRSKALLSLGDDGAIQWDYMTSERHMLSLPADPPQRPRQIALGRRGDAVLRLDDARQLSLWRIDSRYPEVSFQTLFGKVFYEGYDQPEYAWQTTGGEEFEAKLSLVPLLFGTLKGTVYAMLLAVPLALFGAVYTSHFTSPRIKGVVKPLVEVMAAVPSVVLGFLAALWFAPILERWILALVLASVTIPTAFLAFMALWSLVRSSSWARRIENGYEFLVVLPLLVLGAAAAIWLAPEVEKLLFHGNFKLWLFGQGLRYDQRNAIVIAFGLGFAVIPIIFSIAEDALSSVPQSITAASLALGASRWQTLRRVVLPSAAGGIFAAIMIGFGRAVGETMIVLMATGNTPLMDVSPLNGMRTFAANIAVEIPEAPVGGTLYRVLFLCAVFLFLLTFLLNTAAELVRQRLRKRYGRF
jgi:phosphate transport system permease protein